MIGFLLVTALAAAPVPFPEAPAVEIWASEDLPAETLAAAARLPHSTLGVVLRSNMLRPKVAALLQQQGRSLMALAPGLAAVHLDALRTLRRTTRVVALSDALSTDLADKLARLGPQPVRFVVSKLDERLASSLAPVKGAEVELDVRGRIPDQEEVTRFLGLSRARRTVRLRAGDAPAVVAALMAARPAGWVVDCVESPMPEAMVAALVDTGIATRVAIAPSAAPEEVERLTVLPWVSLELRVEDEASLARARALLEAISGRP